MKKRLFEILSILFGSVGFIGFLYFIIGNEDFIKLFACFSCYAIYIYLQIGEHIEEIEKRLQKYLLKIHQIPLAMLIILLIFNNISNATRLFILTISINITFLSEPILSYVFLKYMNIEKRRDYNMTPRS